MLSMLRGKKGKKGFTLIELMIVVAIIGILAAIAIPNFLRFQAKSKQSEAKTNLGGIFTAQTSYFSEFNGFADLGTASWAPVGTSTRYIYTVGGATNLGLTSVTIDAAKWNGVTPAFTAINVSPPGFTAGAQGNIDTDTQNDAWTMNDVRSLSNTFDDVVN